MASRSATVIGLGLIGSSIAKSLSESGFTVYGVDKNSDTADLAKELGLIESIGFNAESEIVFISTPVEEVVKEVTYALSNSNSSTVVTDVAGVKSSIVSQVSSERFVGGHPMAGSELSGPKGADSSMFKNATWVLTPTSKTSSEAYLKVRDIVSNNLGANPINLGADEHDQFVALVSHLPHIVAVMLMDIASEISKEEAWLLRLAAGGFRDMTRIAAGSPNIWPGVLIENKKSVVNAVDLLIYRLTAVKSLLEQSKRDNLMTLLQNAQETRLKLPKTYVKAEFLSEIRVGVKDEPGELVKVLSIARDLDINIEDIEISHTLEDGSGVLLIIIDSSKSILFIESLEVNGYKANLVDIKEK